MQAVHFFPSQCYLGEGPFWHAGRRSCFWVDIENRRLFEYGWPTDPLRSWRPDPAHAPVREWQFDFRVTLVMQDRSDRLILGMEGGLARFDPDTGKLDWLVDIEKDLHKHRCNDGGVDCEGRIWVGTLHRDFDEGTGSVYSIDADLVLQRKMEGLTISNGLVWSPENDRLYFIDSPRRQVESFIFDRLSGEIEFEKVAARIPQSLGGPDGMAMDAEGMLWVAHWGGFGVYRWNPHTGEMLDKIELPVPHVSCCAFAGDNLDHLIITSARQDLDETALALYPQSGDVFVAKVPVKGVVRFKCKY